MGAWLQGKVALVTGGGRGIGRAVVDRFVEEGARAVVLDVSRPGLDDLVAGHGEQVTVVEGNVEMPAANTAAVERALAAFGRLDIFVANAGVFDCFAPLAELPPALLGQAFDEIFRVNVKGALLGARAALGALSDAKGNMIFTLSQAARYPAGGGVLYTASKHALVGVIRQLAHELAPRVRVNGVAPGGTTSEVASPPSLRALCAVRPSGAARHALIARRAPLGFAQEPRDHTAAYVLLASEQGRAITGTVIESDGGVGVRGLPETER